MRLGELALSTITTLGLAAINWMVIPSENITPSPAPIVEPAIAEPTTCAEVLQQAMQAQYSIHWYKPFVALALEANLDTEPELLEVNLDLAYQPVVVNADARSALVAQSIAAIQSVQDEPLCQ
jgi:hypothetical protein